MADEAKEPPGPEWVSQEEAARRLGMSESWFARLAEELGITVERRSGQTGVDWRSVEKWIVRARIDPGTLRHHPERRSHTNRHDPPTA
jgi:hypothetical protein